MQREKVVARGIKELPALYSCLATVFYTLLRTSLVIPVDGDVQLIMTVSVHPHRASGPGALPM